MADTNLIAYLLIRGERTELAERAYQKEPHWAAPLLWRSEFRNVLASYMRRGLLTLEQALELAERAELLVKGREFELHTTDVLELAAASRCSAYDCEFVALARQLRIPLVTCDQAVLSAFPSTVVSLEAFISGDSRISGSERRRSPKRR